MSETKRPVQMVLTDQTCDVCGEGVMRPGDRVLMSSPPQYPHRCTKCGAERIFLNVYPRLDYEEV